MMSSETVAWSSLLLTQLLTIAGRALVLAAGAGLGLTAFRVKSTSLRLFVWSAVLYTVAAVSLRLFWSRWFDCPPRRLF